jgi:hypothetical protein
MFEKQVKSLHRSTYDIPKNVKDKHEIHEDLTPTTGSLVNKKQRRE